MRTEIKTNIKMRVTSEQSEKVQSILLNNGYLGRGDLCIAYTNRPFIYIECSNNRIQWGTSEDFFKFATFLQEVDADLFIRTNGTCEVDKQEFKYPMWFKSKETGDIVKFSDLDKGSYVFINEKYNHDIKPILNKKECMFIRHTRVDNWEQVEEPKAEDNNIPDEEFCEDEAIDDTRNNGGKTEVYQLPDWVKDCDDFAEWRELNAFQFNIAKAVWTFNTQRHSGTNALRDINKILHYAQREKNRILKVNPELAQQIRDEK